MSSPQAITTPQIERALGIESEAAAHARSTAALADAESKHADVVEAHDGAIDMTDAIAQAGRTLERRVIETRLKWLNPNLRFERSINDPTKQGIYLGPTFLCGMEWERSPEFTVNFIETDPFGRQQLLNQVRGWRTVLDTLIRKGALEAEATYRHFLIFKGRESARWSALHS